MFTRVSICRIQTRWYYHFTNTLPGSNSTCTKWPLILNNINNGNLLVQPLRLKVSNSGGGRDGAHGKIRKLWNSIFGKYLLLTNIVGSGILMVVGDVAAQQIEYRRKKDNSVHRFDLQRIGRMFIVGALQGPLHHYVYNWMDKVMPVANLRNVRKTLAETNDELRDKFVFIYCMDWLLWPGAQYVNFRYLDTKYRVTFVNVCTALYNIFMSYVKHDY
uniref:Mpv17-like protein 2 n=1 Tax=Musca domestica TaxID=7370 RepID=A0A1I8N8V2_MUSDO